MSNFEQSADSQIGKLIQESRKARGVTQEQLADFINQSFGTSLHKTAISKIEKGQRDLSLSEAIAISEALSIPIQSFSNAFQPDNIFEIWDKLRLTVQAANDKIQGAVSDLQLLEATSQVFINKIDAGEHLGAEYHSQKSSIREGVIEMRQDANACVGILNEMEILLSDYTRLSGLGDLPASTVSRKVRYEWAEKRMSELNRIWSNESDSEDDASS